MVGASFVDGKQWRGPAPQSPPDRSRRARPLAGSAGAGRRRQPPDDQLGRDGPVLPVGPAGVSPCPGPAGSRRRTLLAGRRSVMDRLIPRDERETSVDQAADRLSYLVLSFGLLAIVAYRSLALHEASWDLLSLVILGGFVGTIYRIRRRVVSRRWQLVAIGSMALASAIAAIIGLAART